MAGDYVVTAFVDFDAESAPMQVADLTTKARALLDALVAGDFGTYEGASDSLMYRWANWDDKGMTWDNPDMMDGQDALADALKALASAVGWEPPDD